MTAYYDQLVVILTANSAVVGSHTDYQLPHYLQSVSVFNSKPIFPLLDNISSVAWQSEGCPNEGAKRQISLHPYTFGT